MSQAIEDVDVSQSGCGHVLRRTTHSTSERRLGPDGSAVAASRIMSAMLRRGTGRCARLGRCRGVVKYLTDATTFRHVSAVRGDVRPRDPRRGRARSTLIRGRPRRRVGKGYLCPKGTTLGHLHHDPDRLRAPMVRDGDQWREVDVGRGVRRAARSCSHGVRRAPRHRRGHRVHRQPDRATTSRSAATSALFIGLSQLPTIYSAGTVDQWPKNVVVHAHVRRHVVDPGARHPAHRLLARAWAATRRRRRARCSRAPTSSARSTRIRARGGKVVVIDPRRTGTADRADEWIPIVPGTDAAFLLAIVQRAVRRGARRPRRRSPTWSTASTTCARVAREFTPEARRGDLPDPGRHASAASPARSRPRRAAAVYGRIGLCNQEFGTLASWLVDVVNILTGNFDRPGGLMFGNPVAWRVDSLPDPQWADGVHVRPLEQPRARRARGARPGAGVVPGRGDRDARATGQIKALVTIAGNPVISAPDAGRLDAALPMLECMISVDNYLNETTRHAHVILPGLSPLEQPHFDELHLVAGPRAAAATGRRAGLPAAADRPARVGDPHPPRRGSARACTTPTSTSTRSTTATSPRCAEAQGRRRRRRAARSYDERRARAHARPARSAPARGATATARCPTASRSSRSRTQPHGIDLGPMVPRVRRDRRARPSGKIELAPDVHHRRPAAPARRALDRDRRRAACSSSRRHLRSNNSWMHNVKVLVKGKDRCTLLVHPDDADARRRRPTARCARVTLGGRDASRSPVEVSDEMMPGVVSLPHGWGHDKAGTRLSVAREHAGVNTNVLAPGALRRRARRATPRSTASRSRWSPA